MRKIRITVIFTTWLTLLITGFSTSAFSQAVIINNGIPSGTLGHWAVKVESAGESRQAFVTAKRAASNDIYTEDVLFDYYSYVDIGDKGGGFRLHGGSTPVVDPNNPNTVSSSGFFIGENDVVIYWEVTSTIPEGEMVMTNRFTFSTANGEFIGRLRFLQYMDEDVEAYSDDVFFTKGSVVGRNLELFTMDNTELYGISHSGLFDSTLTYSLNNMVNAVFVGWAADVYNQMKPRIIGAGQPVALEGIVNNLPVLQHPILGTVLGPRDIVSVLTWEIDNPLADTAVVITTLGGVPNLEGAINPPEIDPPEAGSYATQNISGNDITGDINPEHPTIVLTHGLQKKNKEQTELWTSFIGIDNKGAGNLLTDNLINSNVNIIQYTWKGANQGTGITAEAYKAARKNICSAGSDLAKILLEVLGVGYNKSIHFIGHSLGTAVNAYAARMFLNKVPNVTQAQFTILDYPNHITKMPGMSDNEEYIYGFNSNFFTTILPVFKSELTLRIDNYYSKSGFVGGAGVGDIVNGPVYNHLYNNNEPNNQEQPGLVNPNDVGGKFFEGEASFIVFDNNHSGVHQWYRWTIRPNNPFPGGIGDNVCSGSNFGTGKKPFGFDNSLNPCQKGWYLAINNTESGELWEDRFPRGKNNGGSIEISQSGVLTLENYISHGCFLSMHGGNISVTLISCDENSSPFGIAEVNIPDNAEYLSFEYQFTDIGDGDYVAVFLDNIPMWTLSGLSATAGEFVDSGPIPIKGLTGNRELTIALYGVGELNAKFEIKNFNTFSVSSFRLEGDIDGDGDVDRNDTTIILSHRNQPASECPDCDLDGDGTITVLDARKAILLCTRNRCATE